MTPTTGFTPCDVPPSLGPICVVSSVQRSLYVSSEIRVPKTLHIRSWPFSLLDDLFWGNPPPLCTQSRREGHVMRPGLLQTAT